jgi:hypothetical protein
MQKLFVLATLLFFLACVSPPKTVTPPFLFLGQADQICAGKDGTAKVDVFVILPHPMKATFWDNEKQLVTLYGDGLHLEIIKAGYGAHFLKVSIPDYRSEPLTKIYSVWNCAG